MCANVAHLYSREWKKSRSCTKKTPQQNKLAPIQLMQTKISVDAKLSVIYNSLMWCMETGMYEMVYYVSTELMNICEGK